MVGLGVRISMQFEAISAMLHICEREAIKDKKSIVKNIGLQFTPEKGYNISGL